MQPDALLASPSETLLHSMNGGSGSLRVLIWAGLTAVAHMHGTSIALCSTLRCRPLVHIAAQMEGASGVCATCTPGCHCLGRLVGRCTSAASPCPGSAPSWSTLPRAKTFRRTVFCAGKRPYTLLGCSNEHDHTKVRTSSASTCCRCRNLQGEANSPECQPSCHKHPPSKYTKPSCSEGSSSMSSSHASGSTGSAAAVLAGTRLILEAEPELAICSC